MTDVHAHILPGIDDGARDVATSLEMLHMERAQGVDRVIFTPHFYREREDIPAFLDRRRKALSRLEKAVAQLSDGEREALPRWELGAEVAWMPNLASQEGLKDLCLGTSNYFLLELPFTPWTDQMLHQLYDLIGKGRFIPVIAHLDRYWDGQRRDHIADLLRLGVPIQLSAGVLLKFFSRGRALRLIQQRQGHLLASDCHRLRYRPPNLGSAMEVVTHRLGRREVHRLCRWAEEVSSQREEL